MPFSEDFLLQVRRTAARFAAIPEGAVEPVPHTPVLIAHDASRPGTMLFKIVGKGTTIVLVWEEPPGRVVWVQRRNVTVRVGAA